MCVHCRGDSEKVQEIVETNKINKLSVNTVERLLKEFVSAGRSVEGMLSSLGSIHDKQVLNTVLFFAAVDAGNEKVATAAIKVSLFELTLL